MEETYWDFIRTAFADPGLDTPALRQILEGLLEQVGGEIQSEFIELSDEETRARVSELYGIVYELGDFSLTGQATWILQNCLSYREAETLYADFVFGNPLIPEEVLSMVIRTDPQFSMSELLLQVLRSNVLGSRQYTFERIKHFVRPPFVTPQVLSTCMELARELGDEEGLGFLRRILSERYVEQTVRPNVTGETYRKLKDEECRQLAIYRVKVKTLLETDNLKISRMSKVRQLEFKRMLEEVSDMREVEEGSFGALVQEGFISPRQIKFLEIVRWIELNDLFGKLYGPYNPPRIFGSSVFGSQNPELPELPDDPRRFFMLYNPPPKVVEPDPEKAESLAVDWFRRICDFCNRPIPVRQKAFRTPLPEGGWRGCFCSPTCSLKQLVSGPEYGVPTEELDEALNRIRGHMQFFIRESLGMGWVEGLGFLIRELPLVQYDEEGDSFTSHRRIRMPKIIVSPAREERVKDEPGERSLEEVLQLGEEVLQQLGLDRELLGEESDPIRYVPEVILKREHIERYALTHLMSIALGSRPIVIFTH